MEIKQRKNKPMKVILEDDDVKKAIRNYVRSTVPTSEDSTFDVDFRAGRGGNGVTATVQVSVFEPLVLDATTPTDPVQETPDNTSQDVEPDIEETPQTESVVDAETPLTEVETNTPVEVTEDIFTEESVETPVETVETPQTIDNTPTPVDAVQTDTSVDEVEASTQTEASTEVEEDIFS